MSLSKSITAVTKINKADPLEWIIQRLEKTKSLTKIPSYQIGTISRSIYDDLSRYLEKPGTRISKNLLPYIAVLAPLDKPVVAWRGLALETESSRYKSSVKKFKGVVGKEIKLKLTKTTSWSTDKNVALLFTSDAFGYSDASVLLKTTIQPQDVLFVTSKLPQKMILVANQKEIVLKSDISKSITIENFKERSKNDKGSLFSPNIKKGKPNALMVGMRRVPTLSLDILNELDYDYMDAVPEEKMGERFLAWLDLALEKTTKSDKFSTFMPISEQVPRTLKKDFGFNVTYKSGNKDCSISYKAISVKGSRKNKKVIVVLKRINKDFGIAFSYKEMTSKEKKLANNIHAVMKKAIKNKVGYEFTVSLS